MNKVVYVNAFFKPVGKDVTVKVPTGEKKKGFFGGEKEVVTRETQWKQTGWSDNEIDGQRLANDMNSAIEQLNKEGYEVVTIESIISGAYSYKWDNYSRAAVNSGGASTCYSYGYGYSYTEGVTIIAKKMT
ncbi:hypothetical protein [Marinomonas posidonica]|uniref:Uncharacterized protein n=1 Tax=Marinomonas posidonica (strain CECT 7376 / NCIMB 14433 / IVIA-Po-181) TaxID=491952 RepID=F6CYH5_MARPP|nr:hypothetical protein [Marinomonas posidonica]AEF54584.1 hypothetical protein Mar181_1542 [Marinomonas posidonica IVIA-Po-181]